MTQTVKKTLRDSAGMRWTALLLLALAMFCSYVFMDILSPIKDLMQETRGWDSAAFGRMQGAEVFLNVYVFFLIIAGIILDKMGVRFTAVLSGAVMLIGGIIKFYAVTDGFDATPLGQWFTNNLNWDGDIPIIGTILPFADGMPGSAKLAAIGFMLFGSGCEMAGITVSRGIVKWFKGRETALAMGSEMALAHLGVATCMISAPFFAKLGGEVHVDNAEDDPFKISDLGKIFTSLGFWLVALLCVLYYSAIFPFQKYAVNMLQCNLTLNPADPSTYWGGSTEGFPISVTVVQYIIMLIVAICSFSSNFSKKKGMKYGLMCLAIVALVIYCYMGYMRGTAETIFAVFPLLAVAITPILGNYVDHKGKAASMLMLGSILLVVCHLTFAFILPEFKGNTVGGTVVAYVTILVLGASFSLVPAALWPSVPKLVDEKIIGSAYAAIFWIQNIGLGLFPTLIGIVLQKTNAEGTAAHELDYTWALVMLAILGIAALLISIYLKAVDKKKGYGLEEPNIKPEEKPAQA